MNERDARVLAAMLVVAALREFWGLPPGKTAKDVFDELMALTEADSPKENCDAR
jgi:hypothetical protein